MQTKVVFLDRDGVINVEKDYLHTIEDFEFIKGTFEACRHFQKHGYEIIIVTNQSGIGRGYYSEEDYQNLTIWMLHQFTKRSVNILDVFYCPCSPSEDCECRKPKPGMFLEAKEKYDIDMQSSWVIGDRERDLQAGISAGVPNTILVKSGHAVKEHSEVAGFLLNSIAESVEIIK